MENQTTIPSGTTEASTLTDQLDLVKTKQAELEQQIRNHQAYCERLNLVVEEGDAVIEGATSITDTVAFESTAGTLVGKLEKALQEGPLSDTVDIATDADGRGTALGNAFNHNSVADAQVQRKGPFFNDAATQVEAKRVLDQQKHAVNYIVRINHRLQQARYIEEVCRDELKELKSQKADLLAREEKIQQQIAAASANVESPAEERCTPNVSEDTTQAEEELVAAEQAANLNTTRQQERASQGTASSFSDAVNFSPLDDSTTLNEFLTKTPPRNQYLQNLFTNSGTGSLPNLGTLILPPAGKRMPADMLLYIGNVLLGGTLKPIPNYKETTSYAVAKASQELMYVRPFNSSGRPNGYLAPDFLELLLSTFQKVREAEIDGIQPFRSIMFRITEAFPPTIRHAGQPRYPPDLRPKQRKESRDLGIYKYRSGHMQGYAIDCTVDTFEFPGRVRTYKKFVSRQFRGNWKEFLILLEKTIENLSGKRLSVFNEYLKESKYKTGPHFHIDMPVNFRKFNQGIVAVNPDPDYVAARAAKAAYEARLEARRQEST